MKTEVTTIREGSHFDAVHVGAMNDLKNYTYSTPLGEILGKVFLKESLKLTGAEISFQLLPPETALPFFHQHKQNEEIYIILKGSGQFQVDDEMIPVSEGSVIRVSPEGKRSLNNSSADTMVYMAIQVKQGSLEQWTASDGVITENDVCW